MSGTFRHLRKMKRRLETNFQNPVSAAVSPNEKIEMLEKTLSTFQAEVDMKLKIIQQILTTRNEQVSVHKKLLDREQNLYTALLAHWLNIPKEASDVSVNSSADVTDNYNLENLESEPDQDFDYEVIQEIHDAVPTRKAESFTGPAVKVKPSRKSLRKRRKVTKIDTATFGPFDKDDVDNGDNVDPTNVSENELDEDDGQEDEDWSCPKSEKIPDKGKGNNEIDQDVIRTYVCEVCMREYTHRGSLWRHRLECVNSLNTPKFDCSLCSFTSKRRDHFLRHLTRTHKIKTDRTSCLNYKRSDHGDRQSSSQDQVGDIDPGISSDGIPVISDRENDPASSA